MKLEQMYEARYGYLLGAVNAMLDRNEIQAGSKPVLLIGKFLDETPGPKCEEEIHVVRKIMEFQRKKK